MSAQLQPEEDFIGPRPLPGHCKYRLETTGDNSAKYGLCEVCHQHVSEVFMQTESRWFDGQHGCGWTYHRCRVTVFGHKTCLERLQRTAVPLPTTTNS
jgi:hypothetical protein